MKTNQTSTLHIGLIFALFLLRIATVASADSQARATTPFQIGLGGPVKIPWGIHDVRGLSLGFITANDSVSGLQLSLMSNGGTGYEWAEHHRVGNTSYGMSVENAMSGDMTGIQASCINKIEGTMTGIQFGLFLNENTGNVRGAQLSLIGNGADNLTGLQFGMANMVNNVHGAQIGIINIANNLYGVQIGLLNGVTSSKYRVIPLIRWAF